MIENNIRNALISEVAELNESSALAIVRRQLEVGDDPMDVVKACEQGMRLVGERYERQEYYLSGLIMAGEIFRQVIELVQPSLQQELTGESSGRVLLGTVQGDIHDIGKDIIHILLRCFGFTVEDLGVNVPPQQFLEQALISRPDIIGISGILTSAFDTMKETVQTLRVGVPPHVQRIPIIIGGCQLSEEVCHFVGADYWATDGTQGVHICQQIVQENASQS